MFGRVRIYNLGFVVFSAASLALSLDPSHGRRRRAVADRVADRAGGRRRDADGQLGRHPDRRLPGRAARHGAGGQPDRRARRSVPRPGRRRRAGRRGTGGRCSGSTCRFGVFGTIWSYRSLREVGHAAPARIDWLGNVTFAARRLIGCWPRSPTASSPTAATRPAGPTRWCSAASLAGVVLLVGVRAGRDAGRRADVPARPVPHPGVRRRQPAALLTSIARGGLQFMLIIWLQGIWLPLHGYDLRGHPAVGRHLPAAADRRLPGRRAGLPATCPTASARGPSPPAACC